MKANVVNNLTTTASGKALDGRQGKTLNDKITSLNTQVTNLNNDMIKIIKSNETCNITINRYTNRFFDYTFDYIFKDLTKIMVTVIGYNTWIHPSMDPEKMPKIVNNKTQISVSILNIYGAADFPPIFPAYALAIGN